MDRQTLTIVLALAAVPGAASERAQATATLGGKPVNIDYGRPSLKGRTLAQLLEKLPEDRIWRAGDEEVTTLKTETALVVGGQKVPAGQYSVYMHLPQDGSRSLVLNKDLGAPLKNLWKSAPPAQAERLWPHLEGYEKSIRESEVARIGLKKEETQTPVDPFTISWETTKTGARLRLAWGEEAWSLNVEPAQ